MRAFRTEKFTRWGGILLACLCLGTAAAHAQRRGPEIGCVYPAGGQRGTTVEVMISGQRLAPSTDVLVSGEGISATIVEKPPTLNGKEIQALRESHRELGTRRGTFRRQQRSGVSKGQDGKPTEEPVTWTDADQAEFDRLSVLMAKVERRRIMPALADQMKVVVTIGPDAAIGERDLRVVTASGLSNPLVFYVGNLPETRETASEPSSLAELRRAGQYGQPAPPEQADTETRITLPSTVNGQVLPGDVDRFRFEARQGMHLVARARARALVPYLADAVPGWFQAVLTLYDSNGKEVAYSDDYLFDPDPVLYARIPADGEYVIEIRDSIYRGREDFVYRLDIGQLPFLSGIFPLGGSSDEEAVTVALRGVNLAVETIKIATRGKATGRYPIQVPGRQHDSNRLLFAIEQDRSVLEQGTHDSVKSAMLIAPPVWIDGRIAKAGERDWYQLQGKAGDTIVAEVMARRLGSPLDAVLEVLGADGKRLGWNDDHDDKAAGLETHHADSYLQVTLPSGGTYFVVLGDNQRQGGIDYAYRLRVSKPQPDFAARSVPSSLTVKPGGSVPLTVHVVRHDGCDGDITVTLEDPPEGFSLKGGRVPAGDDKAAMTLVADKTVAPGTVSLRLQAEATVNGMPLVRKVVPADDVMQAFIYRHLVPARELAVLVTGHQQRADRRGK